MSAAYAFAQSQLAAAIQAQQASATLSGGPCASDGLLASLNLKTSSVQSFLAAEVSYAQSLDQADSNFDASAVVGLFETYKQMDLAWTVPNCAGLPQSEVSAISSNLSSYVTPAYAAAESNFASIATPADVTAAVTANAAANYALAEVALTAAINAEQATADAGGGGACGGNSLNAALAIKVTSVQSFLDTEVAFVSGLTKIGAPADGPAIVNLLESYKQRDLAWTVPNCSSLSSGELATLAADLSNAILPEYATAEGGF